MLIVPIWGEFWHTSRTCFGQFWQKSLFYKVSNLDVKLLPYIHCIFSWTNWHFWFVANKLQALHLASIFVCKVFDLRSQAICYNFLKFELSSFCNFWVYLCFWNQLRLHKNNKIFFLSSKFIQNNTRDEVIAKNWWIDLKNLFLWSPFSLFFKEHFSLVKRKHLSQWKFLFENKFCWRRQLTSKLFNNIWGNFSFISLQIFLQNPMKLN